MPFIVKFPSEGFTTDKYDEATQLLTEAGLANPRGRICHFCSKSAKGVSIVDVWENMEDFGDFSRTLRPILANLHVDAGQPSIEPIYNMILP